SLYHLHRHIQSFPTRRSSDLYPNVKSMHLHSILTRGCLCIIALFVWIGTAKSQTDESIYDKKIRIGFKQEKLFNALLALEEQSRSEEHTSELQSRENLVCRLL